jgi:RNA polymerase sigma-70 factor (ECF subfamily)
MSTRYDYDEDRELVENAQNGKQEAFEMLVEKYKQGIFNKCYFHLPGNKNLAVEASHMTFIKAFKAIKKFRAEAAFYTWLYRIAENTCKDIIKEKKKKETIFLNEGDILKNEEDGPKREIFIHEETPQDNLEKEEISETVQNCIKNLSEKLRSVILLHYYEKLKYKDIAKNLNIPEGTAKKRAHAAVKNLQECFRKKGLLK